MSGLYIHIPFCAKKCKYCDFISFVEDTDVMQRYVRALSQEMRLACDTLPKISFDTVFIGGGTPSLLPVGAMTAIFAAAQKYFEIQTDAEITIECNPGTLSHEKLSEYKKIGVNRLSIGLQSSNDDLLREIGRIHSYSDFIKSYDLARDIGFSNINVDVMYGLPKQTSDIFIDTLDKVSALSPTHISAYSLILEENTPLYMNVNSGVTLLPCEEDEYAMHSAGIKHLAQIGYERYEISNYCKAGFESKHNLNYWNNGEYLGVGLNSHSAMRIDGNWTRFCNVSSLNQYFSATENGASPIVQRDTIEKKEEMFECVMLGLRKIRGINSDAFSARFGISFSDIYESAITALVKKHWLTYENGNFALTDEGLDMQNEALMYFMED